MAEIIAPHPSNDEPITLLGVVVVLVKKWRLMFVVFFLVLLAGTLLTYLFVPYKYDFVSLLQVATVESDEYLEPPLSTTAIIGSQWLPEVESEYRVKNGVALPFKLDLSHPEQTPLIVLRSRTTGQNVELVREVHQALLQKVVARQTRLEARYRMALEDQMRAVERSLSQVQGSLGDESGAVVVGLLQRQAELNERLSAVTSAEIQTIGRQSTEVKGFSRSMILVLTVLLGLMLAVVAAFLSEFIKQVKAAL